MSNNKSNESSSIADLSVLYISPSMPNISLGRPSTNSVSIMNNNYNTNKRSWKNYIKFQILFYKFIKLVFYQ